MSKVNKLVSMELECAKELQNLAEMLSSINGKRVSQSAVVEMILTAMTDDRLTIDGLPLDAVLRGYYSDYYRHERKDGRYKE